MTSSLSQLTLVGAKCAQKIQIDRCQPIPLVGAASPNFWLLRVCLVGLVPSATLEKSKVKQSDET